MIVSGLAITRLGRGWRAFGQVLRRLAAVHRRADALRQDPRRWPTPSGCRCTRPTSSAGNVRCSAGTCRRSGCSSTCTTRTTCYWYDALFTLVYTSHFLATPVAGRGAVAARPRRCGCGTSRGSSCCRSPAWSPTSCSRRRRRGWPRATASSPTRSRASRPAAGSGCTPRNLQDDPGRTPRRTGRTRWPRCRRCTPRSRAWSRIFIASRLQPPLALPARALSGRDGLRPSSTPASTTSSTCSPAWSTRVAVHLALSWWERRRARAAQRRRRAAGRVGEPPTGAPDRSRPVTRLPGRVGVDAVAMAVRCVTRGATDSGVAPGALWTEWHSEH